MKDLTQLTEELSTTCNGIADLAEQKGKELVEILELSLQVLNFEIEHIKKIKKLIKNIQETVID